MKSDLSILQDFGASLAPPADGPPAEVRHRVISGMRSPAHRPRLLSRVTGVRLAWQVGAPTGVAAAVAVAAAVLAAQVGDVGAGSPAPPSQSTIAGAGVAPGPGDAPAAPSGPALVLRLAAQHAADTPVLKARPNQFLFIDSVEVQSSTDLKEGPNGEPVPGKTTVSGPQRTRTWLSVDGTRDGLVIQEPAPSDGRQRATRTHIDGCTNGRQAETIDRPETTRKVACTPEPAYQPDSVPTDPEALLAHVYKLARAKPTFVHVAGLLGEKHNGYVRLSDDQRAFQEIAELLYSNHSPAVQAAAFRAADGIAGVQVRGGVSDASGRAGVAVTRTEAGTREELVFNPTTYAYLGHNMITAAFDPADAKILPRPGGKGTRTQMSFGAPRKPGDVIHKSALLRIAIVDKAGQRP